MGKKPNSLLRGNDYVDDTEKMLKKLRAEFGIPSSKRFNSKTGDEAQKRRTSNYGKGRYDK